MVCLFHYDGFLSMSGLPRLVDIKVSSIVHNGYLWVDFFFLLSGFVICHVYGEKLAGRNKETMKKYLWARFSRLYPLHAFVMIMSLIAYFGLVYTFPTYAAGHWWIKTSTMDNFFVSLLFLQNTPLNNPFAWNVPSWSIAAEWWIYIIAIVTIPFLNKKTVLLKNAGAIIVAFIGLYLISTEGNLDEIQELGVLRCLFEFTIGVGIYQLYKGYKDRNTIWSNDFVTLVIGLMIVLSLHLNLHGVITIPFFALFILCASLNNGIFQKTLNIKPLLFLGDISYSFYLTHGIITLIWSWWLNLSFIPKNPGINPTALNHFTWLTLLYGIIIVVSYLTYNYIEVPARVKLKKIILDKKVV